MLSICNEYKRNSVPKKFVANLTDYVQMQMKQPIKIVKSKEKGGIDFTMTVPKAPIVVNCQINSLADATFDVDDDIIAQRKEQTDSLRYQRFFIENPTAKYTFHFSDMNSFDVFKIRCLVENTSLGSNQRFPIGVGLFRGSDTLGEIQEWL